MQEEILVRYIALIILIATIASVFSIVGYFLKGIALYKLAERHKIPNGAMAFSQCLTVICWEDYQKR